MSGSRQSLYRKPACFLNWQHQFPSRKERKIGTPEPKGLVPNDDPNWIDVLLDANEEVRLTHIMQALSDIQHQGKDLMSAFDDLQTELTAIQASQANSDAAVQALLQRDAAIAAGVTALQAAVSQLQSDAAGVPAVTAALQQVQAAMDADTASVGTADNEDTSVPTPPAPPAPPTTPTS